MWLAGRGALRLVILVCCLHLNFNYVTLVFFSFDHKRFSSRLQHSVYNHISISHANLQYSAYNPIIFFSQYHHSILNHFIIHFMDYKFCHDT
jgi:hypothetical protein